MEAAASVHPGTCPKCSRHGVLLIPLHGEKGGPVWCLTCKIDWNAEHGRRRRAGRTAIKAMRLFLRAGGTGEMLTKLKDAAVLADWGIAAPAGYEPDTIGAEVGDITSKLLADTIQLTHPDRHPPERKDLAQRVTSELLALEPFVLPAPKPKPAKPAQPCNGSASQQRDPLDDALRKADAYPCALCVDEAPMNYCSTCKGKWEEEQRRKCELEEKKRKQKAARQRELRAEYKRGRHLHEKPPPCATCGKTFIPTRSDATHCSPACRQKAHRKRDGKAAITRAFDREQVECAIEAALLADPDNAYTTEDLCDRAFAGVNRIERKHRAAIPPAAKAACKRLGEHWDWWRAETRGGTMIFWNRTSVMSYAMARLKADFCNGYRKKPGRWSDGADEEELRARIALGGRDHKYVVENGAWWQHCQEDIAKFKGVTPKQAASPAT